MTEDPKLSIDERRARRLRFLEILYEWTEGDPSLVVQLDDIGKEMGLSHGEAWDLRMFLGREEVLKGVTGMGGISITQKGVRVYERLHAGPDDVFGADDDTSGDTHNYGDVHITAANAQVQQGTRDSSQSMEVSEQTVGDIRSFVGDLQEALEEMKAEGMSEDDADEAAAQATIVEGQLASKKTNWEVVKNALTEIKDVLDAAREIGSTVAPMAVRVAGLLAGL